MKGIVFREFLDMVEDRFGDETVDTIIENSNLKSEGAYTSVGTYNYMELFDLVSNLSKETNISVDKLLKIYGEHVFGIFANVHKNMIENIHDAFSLLSVIENTIHVNVLKLYPDAELPHFEIKRPDDNTLIMLYQSKRKMSDFAEGLIIGSLNHFNEKAAIKKELINSDGSYVKFTISKK